MEVKTYFEKTNKPTPNRIDPERSLPWGLSDPGPGFSCPADDSDPDRIPRLTYSPSAFPGTFQVAGSELHDSIFRNLAAAAPTRSYVLTEDMEAAARKPSTKQCPLPEAVEPVPEPAPVEVPDDADAAASP